jgi:hypothetical protein
MRRWLEDSSLSIGHTPLIHLGAPATAKGLAA